MNNILLRIASISLAYLSSSAVVLVAAYTVPQNNKVVHQTKNNIHGASASRRAFLSKVVSNTVGIASIAASNQPQRALAIANDVQEDVYFGAGCFWHVQHEFVLAERNLLGRKDNELTSLTGYAGGLGKSDKEGRVCYHNFQSIADYGKLGHSECVGLSIPQSSVGDFAVEYFKLFGKKGERADPMDKGGEYRSLLGLPGGKNHPLFDKVEAAAAEQGMQLVDGKGNDPDTLGKKLVYVMDTKQFPFYQAEVCKYCIFALCCTMFSSYQYLTFLIQISSDHQYHNDFLTSAYGKQYNDLAETALDDGRIQITGCPDRV